MVMHPAPTSAASPQDLKAVRLQPDRSPRTGAVSDGGQDARLQKGLYRWGTLLSSTLMRLRTQFGGDFDQYLIYMTFVLSDISRRSINTPGATGQFRPARGMNTLSIAEITEIPRETTRRKLKLLVESGRLKRTPDRLYHLGDTETADEFLEELASLFGDPATSPG